MIAAGAGMNPDPLPLIGRKALEYTVVQLDERVEQPARGIQFERQAAFGEIDLDFVSTFRKTPADLLFMLGEQIPDEFLPRVSENMFR